MLPTRERYHPVLQYRYDSFPICLCRTCAESVFQKQCHHETVLKRAVTGTCFIGEEKLRVERGYLVLKILIF